jgi:hypothetical protein
MEREANTFSGAFLAPATDIGPYFSRRRIDLALLANLKPEWRMAMAALLYKAKQLGFVNDNQTRYLWQQFTAHKIRMREPPELDFPPEKPSLMSKLLSLHIEELGYSISELASMLFMQEEELASLMVSGQSRGMEGRSYELFRDRCQRVRAACRATSARFSGVILAARALPPLAPQGSRGRIFGCFDHVFLNLAGEDLGDADRIGGGISGSFLTLRSLRHNYLLDSLKVPPPR